MQQTQMAAAGNIWRDLLFPVVSDGQINSDVTHRVVRISVKPASSNLLDTPLPESGGFFLARRQFDNYGKNSIMRDKSKDELDHNTHSRSTSRVEFRRL